MLYRNIHQVYKLSPDLPVHLFGLRDTCRLMIRKIQFAPDNTKAGPKAEISRQFMMSDKPIHLEASLEKEVCLGLEILCINCLHI